MVDKVRGIIHMAQKTVPLDLVVKTQVSAYQKALHRAKIPVSRLIVFGSRAKGTAHWYSDIDLAVVSPSFGKDRHRELVKLLGLRTDATLDIEPHPMHPDDLNDRWSTLSNEVKKYGIPV